MSEYLCIALYLIGAYQTKEMVEIVCENRGYEYHFASKAFACLVWPFVALFVFACRVVGK